MEFGDVRFEEEGEPFEVVVSNGGELPMETSAVRIVGEGAADFVIEEDGCSLTTVATGEACTILLRFVPTAVGARNATLEVIGRKEVPLELVGRSVAPRLDRFPEVVDFADQPVGGRAAGGDLRIENGGTAQLSLDKVYIEGRHSGEFRLAGRCDERGLAPGESCGFRIAFSPRAAGARSAELVFETDAPSKVDRVVLQGTGVWDGPELVAEPATYNAGLQRVGAAAVSRKVRFVNRAAEGVTVSALEVSSSASGFTVAAGGCGRARLEPGDDCVAEVRFRPEEVGERSATLDLRLDGGGGASVPLTGKGGNARLALGAETLDLGKAQVDAGGQTASLELSSSGELGLNVDALSVRGVAASSYSVEGGACLDGELAPGERCSVTVSFRPRSEGTAVAELTIESDSDGGTVSAALTGEGLAGRLRVNPERLDLGSVRRGGGERGTLRLENAGSAEIAISSATIAGRAEAEFLIVSNACNGAKIAPGAGCAVEVRFLPGTEGKRLAYLVVDHDAIAGPGEIPLSGTGLPPVPTIRVEPDRLEFGSLSVGDFGAIQTVTIRNPGLGPLQIRDVLIANDSGGHFRFVPGTCAGVPKLAPRSDCSFGVRFTPQASGSHSAELVVTHDARGGTTRVPLTGQGRAVVGATVPAAP